MRVASPPGGNAGMESTHRERSAFGSVAVHVATFGVGAGVGAFGTVWALGGIGNALRDKPGTVIFVAGSAAVALRKLYRKAREQSEQIKMQEPDPFDKRVAVLCHPSSTDEAVAEIMRADPNFKSNLEGNLKEAMLDVALHKTSLQNHPNNSYYTKALSNAQRDSSRYATAMKRIVEFEASADANKDGNKVS